VLGDGDRVCQLCAHCAKLIQTQPYASKHGCFNIRVRIFEHDDLKKHRRDVNVLVRPDPFRYSQPEDGACIHPDFVSPLQPEGARVSETSKYRDVTPCCASRLPHHSR
jgi:hypothetical protein